MNIKQTLAITQKGQQKENHEIQHTILKTMKGDNNPVEIRQRKSREKNVKKMRIICPFLMIQGVVFPQAVCIRLHHGPQTIT